MSRLDSAIRRLEAQRACLELAAHLVARVPGPVVELGLGNGRTYDHLRGLLPDREVFAFDRQLDAHPDCIPDKRHLIMGDFEETVPRALDLIGARVALLHADTGTGEAARNAKLAAWLSTLIPPLMTTHGVVVSDQELVGINAAPIDLPEGVSPGRYFLYRIG